jgi:hypothetical protein
VAYTGSRHRRSVPKKSQIPAGQYAPDVNPSSIGVAADVSFSPSTGVAAAGGATITATVKRAAASVRKVEVGTGVATNLVILSDTKFTFTAPAQAAGARDVVIYDGVASVTKTGGLTYV